MKVLIEILVMSQACLYRAAKRSYQGDLPPNFCFTTDDPFYSGPATCNLLHYTPAAYMAGFIEMAMLASGSIWFWQLHSVNHSVDTWVVLCMFALTAAGLVTSLLMFYGLKTEQARLLSPKLAFIQLEITILMLLAAIAIVAMSFGISLTHQLFSVFIK
ncbi:hypothetical protein COOONC_16128 [Cooperia oncophora]